MRRLKAGIVGLGRIASLYEKDAKASRFYPSLTHAGSITKNGRIELVCGADINAARRRAFGEMWGVEEVYADYKKMLAQKKIDILSICTSPDSHYDIIRAAAGRVKIIFCEKPFTNNSSEIRRVIDLKKKTGTRIEINLYREYDDSHNRIKNIIMSGKMGRVQRVNCYYGKGLRNMGSHLLGYLTGIFGMPDKIKVLGKRRYGISEYTYDVYLEFKGVPVMLQGCDFNKYRLFEIDFVCERGRVQILDEGFTIRTFTVRKNRAETGAHELREKSCAKGSVGSAMAGAVEHLVRSCLDKKRKPVVSPERYLKLQLLIEKIEMLKKGTIEWR